MFYVVLKYGQRRKNANSASNEKRTLVEMGFVNDFQERLMTGHFQKVLF